MHRILQFVADHKIILWLILASGKFTISTATILYQQTRSLWLRLLAQFEHGIGADIPLSHFYVGVSKRCVDSTFLRVVSVIQGLACVALAIAGFMIL